MLTRGEFSTESKTYGAIVNHTKSSIEIALLEGTVLISAYKSDASGEYCFNNILAKDVAGLIKSGIHGCNKKNGIPAPFALGAIMQHEFEKSKAAYIVQMYDKELAGIIVDTEKLSLKLDFSPLSNIPNNIPYIKLTVVNNDKVEEAEDELDAIPIRTVEEIALTKEDVTWLKNKKYYIVNDDETAEKLFNYLDNYSGPISYDTETTGLKINCFGKINSKYQHELIKHNNEHPEAKIRADKLVGIIFCVEPNVSYYFPVSNRKFKNLYENKNSEIRKKLITNIKTDYTIGKYRDKQSDFSSYWRDTPEDLITSDCILMERCRKILEQGHIVAHNGAFEWKVGWQYEIDTNLKDDTMILHQLMYKFRSTTSNRGESSSLKYLAKRELGVDQWELSDFFVNYKEDNSGLTRANKNAKKSKKNSLIDFSYMDYQGTRIYAPTDGDVTLQLFLKYKHDMKENHTEMEYIYDVEVLVACAVGYMEFYGHRLDMTKVMQIRQDTITKIALLESEIRQNLNFTSKEEQRLYDLIKDKQKTIKSSKDKGLIKSLNEEITELTEQLSNKINTDEEHPLNLASPAQVAEVFYTPIEEGGCGYKFSGDKPSVAKKEIKALIKEKNPDGTAKNIVAWLYSEYKKEDTLLTKFFDNLIYYTYPGGFIFSSFGQISTATGRMSCSKPNSQQYPKAITKIVIPRDGYVMADADYSQIEYRVLTAMAGNKELAVLFENPDSDYHTLMASLMYEEPYESVTAAMRSAAKSFNFGIPYGMGLGSLAILLYGVNNAKTRADAAEKLEMYYKNQPRTKKFFQDVKEMALVNGFTQTLFHRYRYYSFNNEDGTVNEARKAAALRQAGNAVIQGCLHGDTKIETLEHGIVSIKDVVGYRGKVWNGTKWTHGDVLYSGKKQKCIIRFWNGQKFICSPIHKFLKAGTNPNDINNYIECQDLKSGDLIEFNEQSELKIDMYNVIKELEKPSVVFIDNDEECINTSVITKSKHGLEVESVEITDEYIDMYDVCNTDEGYYVADGIITHNTAADIFKIGVARNFTFIRNNNILGKLLIVNMVHDEQLLEIDAQSLNVQRILAEVGKNMQFKLDGFPPLYIGAGIGKAWGYAKGKMAEIHPNLLKELTEEAENIPIFRDDTTPVNTDDVLNYFDSRVLNFRKQKVYDYITNSENWGKDMHPAIGSLINLQFNYGRGEDAKEYKKEDGSSVTDAEFLTMNLTDFIKETGAQVDPNVFSTQEMVREVEKDTEYEDNEDIEDIDDIFEDYEAEDFAEGVISKTDDTVFGSTINDLVAQFKVFVSRRNKICAIDTRDIYYKNKDAILDYLEAHSITLKENEIIPDDPKALEVAFLSTGNQLNRTGIYVKEVKQGEIEKIYKYKYTLS